VVFVPRLRVVHVQRPGAGRRVQQVPGGPHRRFSSYLDLEFPLFSDRDLEVSDAFGVTYRTFKVFPRSKRSVYLVDTDGVVRYRWIGDHPLDPTRDQPPLAEIREAVEELAGEEPETFGFN
jgi:peroxiredoxin